jgi:hypothetical protein
MAAVLPKSSILVTSTNGELGSAIVRHLALSPGLAEYRRLFTVRDTSACKSLWLALGVSPRPKGEGPDNIVSLGLSSLSEVRKVAGTINSQVQQGRIPPL